jgi:hypothetical protein
MAKLGILNFKKLHLWAVLLAAGLAACFALLPEANAGFLPLPETTNLDVPVPEGITAIQKIENILGPLGRAVRIVVGIVAVALFVVSGFIMVVAGDNEESVGNQKKALTYGVIGLALVSIAGPVAEVFDFRQGNYLEDSDMFLERVELFDGTTRMFITFIKYILGGLAALSFIRSGVTFVIGSHNEENVTSEKKSLLVSASGLMLVFVSDLVVRRILYNAEYNSATSETVISINQSEAIRQLVAITNILVSFVGPIMMLSLVAGGLIYITARGDEEKTGLAKKIMLNSVIGIVIIYGAFAIVSTIIAGVF